MPGKRTLLALALGCGLLPAPALRAQSDPAQPLFELLESIPAEQGNGRLRLPLMVIDYPALEHGLSLSPLESLAGFTNQQVWDELDRYRDLDWCIGQITELGYALAGGWSSAFGYDLSQVALLAQAGWRDESVHVLRGRAGALDAATIAQKLAERGAVLREEGAAGWLFALPAGVGHLRLGNADRERWLHLDDDGFVVTRNAAIGPALGSRSPGSSLAEVSWLRAALALLTADPAWRLGALVVDEPPRSPPTTVSEDGQPTPPGGTMRATMTFVALLLRPGEARLVFVLKYDTPAEAETATQVVLARLGSHPARLSWQYTGGHPEITVAELMGATLSRRVVSEGNLPLGLVEARFPLPDPGQHNTIDLSPYANVVLMLDYTRQLWLIWGK